MTIATVLQALYNTELAAQIRENETAFPCIESVHVLAVTLVVGSIAIVDLRLLGLASRERSASRVAADVLPLTWGAFAAAAVSGFLMFMSNAPAYSHNRYFCAKLVLLGLAGINMALLSGLPVARPGQLGHDAAHAAGGARRRRVLAVALDAGDRDRPVDWIYYAGGLLRKA